MDLERLLIPDIKRISHLQPEGWEDIANKFREYCSRSFCHPVKLVAENQIVGIGVLILHKDSAWLAHIIVDKSYRGQGIGNRIVTHLVQYAAKNGFLSINLIATELGAPVYKKVGFYPVCNYVSLKKTKFWPASRNTAKTITASKEQYQQILRIDREISGENRQELISPYLTDCIVYTDGGSVEGFYVPGLGQGPIYAVTDRAGLALMELKYSSADIAVLPEANNTGIEFLIQRGFEIQNTTAVRMAWGQELPWQPQNVFSRIGGNYG